MSLLTLKEKPESWESALQLRLQIRLPGQTLTQRLMGMQKKPRHHKMLDSSEIMVAFFELQLSKPVRKQFHII